LGVKLNWLRSVNPFALFATGANKFHIFPLILVRHVLYVITEGINWDVFSLQSHWGIHYWKS